MFIPAVGVSYLVFGVFLALVALFASPGVASAFIRGPDIVAQVIFTPLLASWSIWVGMAISTRAGDIRVAQQMSILASLPTIALTTLIALGTIPATTGLALGLGAALVVANRIGWRLVSAMFDRERLITSTRGSRSSQAGRRCCSSRNRSTTPRTTTAIGKLCSSHHFFKRSYCGSGKRTGIVRSGPCPGAPR